MSSDRKPKSKATKKKAHERDLTPEEKKSVDRLCALWQRVLNYRCALQHRLELHKGKFSNVLDVFESEDDAKAYTWIDNERGLANAKYDLDRFDTRLKQHTNRQEPPNWILTDWLPLPSGLAEIETTVDRFVMFVIVDSLEYRAPRNAITGGEKGVVIPAIKAVIDLLKNKEDERRDIYESRLKNVVGRLCTAATYINNPASPDRSSPDPLFVGNPVQNNPREEEHVYIDPDNWKIDVEGWIKQSEEKYRTRKTKLLEILNRTEVEEELSKGYGDGDYLSGACYIVGQVLGTKTQNIYKWARTEEKSPKKIAAKKPSVFK